MTQGYSIPDAQVLDYAGRDVARRPGLLTALGVCSIVIGALGILMNVLSAGLSAQELIVSYENAGLTPAMSSTSADTTAPNTLTVEESRLIVSALAELQPLDADERRRLEEALRKSEAPVAPPLAGVPWTADHVKKQVISSATHLPGEPLQEQSDGDATTGAHAEVDATAIDDTFKEREIHFDFGDSGDAWIYADHIDLFAWTVDLREIDTTVWADGTVEVYDGGYSEGAYGFWWDLQLWMSLIAALAGVMLAVLLIVAGVLTLRDRPSATSLHRCWAWARIILSVLATAIGFWGLVQVGDFLGLGEYHWPIMASAMVAQFLLWCAYPAVVLIVLRTDRVRDWNAAGLAQASSLSGT